YYRDISERVSTILDVIGYSQKDRDRKVTCATASEVFSTMGKNFIDGNLRFYQVGSRGESSTGPGLKSDRDELFVDERFKAVTDLSDCDPGIINYLMVYDDYTHPGYVKLQCVDILPDNTPHPVLHRQGNNIRVGIQYCNVRDGVLLVDSYDRSRIVSGPALHYKHNTKCAQWPNEAHEWFQSRRLYAWPKSNDLQNGRKDGCFVAAVGHHICREPNLDWRLSFSFTERRLISAAKSCRVNMLRGIPQEYNIMTMWIREIKDALQHAPDTLRIYLQYLIMILLSQVGFHVVSICKENAHVLFQEEVDYLMGLASSLGKERHQQVAMDNMIHVVRTYSDIPDIKTELNLLGYCFMRETRLKNAFIWFSKSLKMCPHHNAAKFYLGFLFRK
ncbi:hypothetical protein CHS0354_031098, partial [Potamilus streckersoni]